ncbi:putative endoglucanase precursor [Komagataeibacter saccharivorans]|uniref:Glucanase n=1 Tax=Komagataeibacter saccharivorans TaxID=265959 RepID=A0A347W941_9PROT|nr:glycosyl hydrolase family 8 [Komagataeibacter saccharivorans]AXY21384.1 putative endoglucanase precursor [Komagataeibacter saccharivorans]
MRANSMTSDSGAPLPPRPAMGRRTMLAALAAIGGGMSCARAASPVVPPGPDAIAAQWAIFRAQYFRPDGRIVDTGNNGQSHSEGQGYGMLFAVAAGDLQSFEVMWNWARTTLQHTKDKLFSWRFLPDHDPAVPDTNNATDGDLLIALALGRAGVRWGRTDLVHDAIAIYRDVLKHMTLQVGGYRVLLPGATGFVTPDVVTLNLSYYIMPALLQALELTADRAWRTIMHDGMRIILQARFGQWRLPADWVAMDRHTQVFSIAKGWPPRFSYDAIRVPLYLYWAHMLTPRLQADYARFWNHFGADGLPAWVDLTTGARSPYNAPPGYLAVAQCTGLASVAELPTLDHSPDYYSAALTLLVYIARAEEQAK